MATDLNEAKDLADAGRYAEAWKIVAPAVNDNPDEPRALSLAIYMLEKQGQGGIAYQLAKFLANKYPNNPSAWISLGKCSDTIWRMDEAEAAYRRALSQVKTTDTDTKATIYTNYSALMLQLGQFDKAKDLAKKALDLDPDKLKARHNYGLCLLAEGQWEDGWKFYEASVGSPQRIAWNYNGEPAWKGEPDGTVVIYGEQGIGDEICAASMVPDAIDRAKKVIIDCDARLAGLFQRSFPKAKVYGTRNEKTLNWAEEDQEVNYSIPSMQLGGIFRPDKASFPGEPYLVADPERVLMWKALWKSKKKPVIGIAWSGGIKETASMYRRWSLDDLASLMTGIDAHWVSLQYKDSSHEVEELQKRGFDIKQYPATTSKDYDDTAGLVASLDCVVAMQSTAVHISGALGVPCAAGIPKTSQWRYGTSGDSLPWYKSVKLFRQKELGKWNMEELKTWLSRYL